MLRVLHLTDTHLVAVEDDGEPPTSFAGSVAKVQGRTTTQSLRRVLDAVAADGYAPDLVLHTGDAADDGERATYALLRSMLDELGAPVLAVPGNHDRADVLAAAFDAVPAVVRSLDLDGWRIVVVDTAKPHHDHGELSAAGMAALDDVLGSAAGAVLVGLHHPPITVCPRPSCGLVAADEVREVLERHRGVRAVASGHLHVTQELERAGIAYLLSPSTCLQLRHEHPLPRHNRNPTPVGARLIDLHDDGRVTSRIVWA